MNFKDFFIGQVFYTATGAWLVTDKGTRVVVAIHLETSPDGQKPSGPPYFCEEIVFDEYDFAGCWPEQHI